MSGEHFDDDDRYVLLDEPGDMEGLHHHGNQTTLGGIVNIKEEIKEEIREEAIEEEEEAIEEEEEEDEEDEEGNFRRRFEKELERTLGNVESLDDEDEEDDEEEEEGNEEGNEEGDEEGEGNEDEEGDDEGDSMEDSDVDMTGPGDVQSDRDLSKYRGKWQGKRKEADKGKGKGKGKKKEKEKEKGKEKRRMIQEEDEDDLDQDRPRNSTSYLEQQRLADFKRRTTSGEQSSIDELRNRASVPVLSIKRSKQERATGRVTKNTLPPYLSKTMGDANMAFSLGHFAEAVVFLQEIIRHAPAVSLPYTTLGLIYDELNDPTKALQYKLLAAHLTSGDTDQWIKLGRLSRNQQMLAQAAYCYTKALKIKPRLPEVIYERSLVYLDMNESRKALDGFKHVLRYDPGNIKAVKELAKIYNQRKAYKEAVALFEGIHADPALSRNLDLSCFHMLAELYIIQKHFDKAKALIESLFASRSHPREAYPIDLLTNYAICLIHLSLHQQADEVLASLLNSDVNENSDLFVDVGNACLERGLYDQGLLYYRRVVEFEEYNKPPIWHKMATCLLHTGDLESAEVLANAIIDMDPAMIEGKQLLVTIYERQGKHIEALKLSSEFAGVVDSKDFVEEHQEAPKKRAEKKEKFAEKAWKKAEKTGAEKRQAQVDDSLSPVPFSLKLGSGDSLKSRKRTERPEEAPEEMEPAKRARPNLDNLFHLRAEEYHRDCVGLYALPDKTAYLEKASKLFLFFKNNADFFPEKASKSFNFDRALRPRPKNEGDNETQMTRMGKILTKELWTTFIFQYTQELAKKSQFQQALSTLRFVVRSNVFYQDQQNHVIFQLYMITMAFHLRQFERLFGFIRDFFRNPEFKDQEVCIANMFLSLVSSGGPDAAAVLTTTFFDKYTKRLHARSPNNSSLKFLLALRSMLSNSIGYSIGYGKDIIVAEPEHPLGYLMVGISVIHVAAQRRTARKSFFILQGFAFLFRYLELSKHSGEATYNIGRAFHLLALFHLAIPFYEKVLSMAVEPGKPSRKPQAAYNLAHMYASNGSTEKAQALLQQYCSL